MASFKVGRGVLFCLRKFSYLVHFDYVKRKPKFKSGMENMRLEIVNCSVWFCQRLSPWTEVPLWEEKGFSWLSRANNDLMARAPGRSSTVKDHGVLNWSLQYGARTGFRGRLEDWGDNKVPLLEVLTNEFQGQLTSRLLFPFCWVILFYVPRLLAKFCKLHSLVLEVLGKWKVSTLRLKQSEETPSSLEKQLWNN